MKVLVTGGLGFAGSWIARHLAVAGYDLLVCGRAERAGRDLPDLGAPYRYIQADVTHSPSHLADYLPQVGALVHAASHNDAHCPDYGALALQANVAGTRNLLEALRLRGMAIPFVYLSTFHVYGAESGRVAEDRQAEPGNDYALTHLLAEEYCRYYRRSHNLPTIVLRLANGYGAPLTRPFGKWYLLLPDMCRMARRDKRISLRSPGNIRRDFLWLGDAAAVVEKTIGLAAEHAGPFNVASGSSRSIAEVADLVAERCQVRYGFRPPVQTGPDRPDQGLEVDTARLRRVLPDITFHDALANEIDATFAALEAEEGMP